MKRCSLYKILVLVLILVSVVGIAAPAFAASYTNTAFDGDTYTLKIGDTLELYNPESSSGMRWADYYWGVDTDNSANPDAVTVTDNDRYGIITAEEVGTAKIYAELYGSIPITNYGKRYNSAKKEWESYTYTTYSSRMYRRYITVKVYSNDPPKVNSLPDTVYTVKDKKTAVTVKATTNTGTSLKYQWYFKNKGASSFSKSDFTGKTYAAVMNANCDGRKVYCVVKDGNGRSTKSETVTLKMAAPLKITAQSKTTTVTAGSYAKATVTATGQGTLKYQWYYKNAGSSSYSKSDFTGKTYSVKMTPAVNGRKVYCAVSDAYGRKLYTDAVTLKMSSKLGIYSQPQSDKAVIGDKVSATVKANGSGTLKYQWYYKNKGAEKFTKSSQTTATYSVKMTAEANGRKIYCVVTDSAGSKVTSNTVTLSSVAKLKITAQPKGITVKTGETAKSTVTVSGGSGVKYQWYWKDPSSKSFNKSSITSKTYSAEMKAARDGRKIYCVITDGYGQKVTTNTVTLNMADPIKITKQPVDTWQVAGETIKVPVRATGEGTLKYQWYWKNANSSYTNKSSITSSTYSITMTEAADRREIYCVITDNYGQKVTTDTVMLINDPPIIITEQPKDSRYLEVFTIQYTNPKNYWYTKEWFARKPGGEFIGLTSSAGLGTNDYMGLYSEEDIDDPLNYIGGEVYCTIRAYYDADTIQEVKSDVVKILP